MKNVKFYDFISDSDKKYLSLNFILSEKIYADSFTTEINIKSEERKAISSIHHNHDFESVLFNKHMSRYIQDIHEYGKELI